MIWWKIPGEVSIPLAHHLGPSPLKGEGAFIYIGDEMNFVFNSHKNLPIWTSSSGSLEENERKT